MLKHYQKYSNFEKIKYGHTQSKAIFFPSSYAVKWQITNILLVVIYVTHTHS